MPDPCIDDIREYFHNPFYALAYLDTYSEQDKSYFKQIRLWDIEESYVRPVKVYTQDEIKEYEESRQCH